jgi:hypothetical protein
MKNIKNLFAIFLIVALNSCMDDNEFTVDPNIEKIEKSEWNTIKKDAEKAFEEAYNEFFNDIPTFAQGELIAKGLPEIPSNQKQYEDMELPPPPEGAENIEYSSILTDSTRQEEINPEEYNTAERIKALAMEAEATGNSENLITYLKHNGLYDKYIEIAEKYELEEHVKRLNLSKKSISEDKFTDSKFVDGDIFLKYDNSSSGSSNGSSSGSNVLNWLIPGKWGHAAYMDAEKRKLGGNNYLLSASNMTDQGDKAQVGYDMTVGYWTNASEVAVSRVKTNHHTIDVRQ